MERVAADFHIKTSKLDLIKRIMSLTREHMTASEEYYLFVAGTFTILVALGLIAIM